MRIAHVISSPHGVGGAEQVMLGITRHADGEHVVLNPFAGTAGNRELAAAGESEYREWSCVRSDQLPATLLWLRRTIADLRPDVIHAHLFHAMVATSLPGVVGSGPRVLSHHHAGCFVEEGQPIRERVDCWSGKRFDRIVAVSDWSRHFLLDRYRYPPASVETVLNGWEGTPFPPAPSARPTIICVAHLRWQKGHDDLLRACAALLPEFPELRLVLVGDGEERDRLRALARDLGLEASVEWAGHVDDVWPLLADAHVCALASRYEPLGLAVLEAMAASLPTVAYAVGGLRELIVDGVTGSLVAPDDHDALAEGLRLYLRNPGRAREVGRAAARWAEEHTMQRMAQAYQGLYRELCSA